MKQGLLIALFALAGFVAQAQVQETRGAQDFSRIEVKNGIEVILTPGQTATVKVEADNHSSLKSIQTRVEGNTLKIYLNNENINQNHTTLKVYVPQGNITGIKATSGAVVRVQGDLKVNGLAVDLASGASFKGKVTCAGAFKLDARAGSNFDGVVVTNLFYGDLKGGSVVKIAGIATKSVINSANGSTCLAANFKCTNAVVNARTTSTVVVNVKESISAATDDSASITYYGNPADTYIGPDSYAVRRKK